MRLNRSRGLEFARRRSYAEMLKRRFLYFAFYFFGNVRWLRCGKRLAFVIEKGRCIVIKDPSCREAFPPIRSRSFPAVFPGGRALMAKIPQGAAVHFPSVGSRGRRPASSWARLRFRGKQRRNYLGHRMGRPGGQGAGARKKHRITSDAYDMENGKGLELNRTR